ncbi:MAG: Ig-like domain-containing protein [Prevotella sp.]|nr:Ig-like domain-containing protein [Prevotella sp.]
MKQTTKYIFALVVMILSVTDAMAAYSVIKMIDGALSLAGGPDPGTVIYDGSGKITVTPNADYYLTLADLTVTKTIDGSNANARRRAPGFNKQVALTAQDATADPSGVTVYTFTVEDTNYDYEIEANFHTRTSISGASVTVVGDPFAYTGTAITPSVTVTLAGAAASLTEGTDYTLSYASNTDVGTGQITVTGIRTYTGTITQNFTIYLATVPVTASGYYGVYDGDAHGITVTAPADATVKYGEAAGVYDREVSPMYVDAGTYTVYYQATKAGLNPTTGSETVTIAKAPASISYETTAIKKTYGDSEFTNPLTLTGDGTETYRTSDRDVAVVDAATGEVTIVGEGTATITATVADGMNYTYDPNSASYEITVEKARMTVTSSGWTGDYDGQPHSITVNAPEGAKVRYGRAEDSYNLSRIPTYTNTGSYTCYYQVTMDNYYPVTGHETVTINKAAATISFETASVEKIKGDAAFTNPLTNTGDGKVTYSTSNSSVAAVNATTGEVTVKNYGTATITATVKEGVNYVYAENTATFDVTVGTASMDVTAEGYEGVYDGKAHGITVTVTSPEGATVKYGETEGVYNRYSSPTYTNAGTYSVYYQVTKTNYTTVTGSATVTIAKADAKVEFAQKELTAKIGKDFTTPKLTLDPANLTVTYSSSNEEVATVDAETGEVELVSPGEVTITATFAGDDNYNGASDAYVLTVLQRDIDPIDEDVIYSMDDKDFFIYDDDGNLVEIKLDNTVIFDILFTLDISGDPAESDGFDETEDCIVLNHPMATNDVDRIIFNGVEPGTDDYAGEYTGLTFKVPAGKGYVIIDSQTDGDYMMMVKIGELAPVAFNHTSREKDSIFYECTVPTWVYVYNGGEVNKARMVDHRAKKTKGRVKIYSITRSNSNQAPTGIEIINGDAQESVRWYDLQGNRISRPTKKGLYILRGQKVIVR